MKEIHERICSDIWTTDDIFRNHRELCLRFRGRFSGSENEAKAALFIESKLKDYGLSEVCRDWFDMTVWQRGTAKLLMVSPEQISFPCHALPYSPPCDRQFDLLDLDKGHPEDVQSAGAAIKGKAVIVDDINPVRKPNLHRLQKYLNVLEAGASAFLFAQKNPGMLAPTGSLAFNHSKEPSQVIPSVGLAQEVSQELKEWLKRGPVKVKLRLENNLFSGKDCNVMGVLSGEKSSDETVIVGAHYDGHDIAQGAVDNASGTAAVMEIARVLAKFKDQLKTRIMFVLFGSEEMGLLGSHFFVKKYESLIPKVRFVFNLDCVGVNGGLVIMLQNAINIKKRLKEMAIQLPSDINITDHMVPFSDHFPFFLHGVPSGFCCTPGTGDRGWGHTIADTFEKVPREILQYVAMQIARLVFLVGQDQDWPGRHATTEETRSILAQLDVEKLLRYEGHWPFEDQQQICS